MEASNLLTTLILLSAAVIKDEAIQVMSSLVADFPGDMFKM